MNKTDLNRCFDRLVPSAKQKEDMLASILGNTKGATMKKMNWIRLPVAAAIVICFATTALALTFGLHEKLIEYFRAGDEQQLALLETARDTPEASIRENGVTITVIQTITDRFGIYVLYEMTVPEEITLSDEMIWRVEHIKAPLEEEENAGVVVRNEILEQDAQHRMGVLSCFASSSPIVSGTMEVFFRDLGYLNAEMAFITLLEGEWRLSWETAPGSGSVEYILNESIPMNGEMSTIKTIDLSPISMNITATHDAILHAPIMITFRDGTQLAIDDASGRSISGGSLIDETTLHYEYHKYHRFDQLIDPNEVESIQIDGNSIALR